MTTSTSTSPMSWLGRVDTVARIVLWLSIASACVVVPAVYLGQKREEKRAETAREAELLQAMKKAEAKLEELEKAKKPGRLSLASMGTHMSSIAYSTAQGSLWFTNVSSRTGIICVVGVAAEVPDRTSESLPACQEVAAHATVHVTMMFAGGDLAAACPKSSCHLTFREPLEGS